jgi:hypothetical protein
VRIIGGIACAAVVAYCAFGTGAAMADTSPERFDVVVFKYPKAPQQSYTPMNYIKRLIGKPGETIAIKAGKLYVLPPGTMPPYSVEKEAELEFSQRDVPPLESTLDEIKADLPKLMWHRIHMHPNDPDAKKLFENGKFQIIRKPPEKILAMMRLVYDNDHPPSDLPGAEFERWQPADKVWVPAGRGFDGTGADKSTHWLRYHHLVPNPPTTREEEVPGTKDKVIVTDPRATAERRLITDVLGYNSKVTPVPPNEDPWGNSNWVSDLIVEVEATIDQADGQFTLELSKAKSRFRARWDVANGICTLVRVDENQKEVELASAPTSFKGKGTKRRLRFANVDDRLTVWVDSTLAFRGGAYPDGGVNLDKSDLDIVPSRNDFEPASIGLSGEARVGVDSLKLFRDIYYTNFDFDAHKETVREDPVRDSHNDVRGNFSLLTFPQGASVKLPDENGFEDWQKSWQQAQRFNTLYVQPGHYLCLGDNSSHSADSRTWGLVPERLMLGRALVVYWPIKRIGRIR